MARNATENELIEIVEYWRNLPKCSGWHEEEVLINFLRVFTPKQIKGAMYSATSKGRQNYFKYLCGILHNWKKDIDAGVEPAYFEIND